MAENNQKPSLSWSQPATPAAKPAPATTPVPTTAPAVKPATATSNKAVVEATSSTGMYVGIFVAGLIVGALIGWGISASRGPSSTTASSTSMTSTATSTDGGNAGAVNLSGSTIGSAGSVSVAATQTAGFAVNVSKISVSAPTWLVVYEDTNGAAGKALGAELFFPSSNSGTIELLRATTAGQSYLVGQSVDNGDKVFNLKDDKVVSDEKGNPLYTEFKAQ